MLGPTPIFRLITRDLVQAPIETKSTDQGAALVSDAEQPSKATWCAKFWPGYRARVEARKRFDYCELTNHERLATHLSRGRPISTGRRP